MRRKSVVVIGGGQGGLSAAIYARLAGHEVLLLEKGSRVGGKAAGIETHGYRLDPGPSIIILPRIYEAVFRAAGRQMSDYLRLHRLDPISRVYFKDQSPVDLPADREECARLVAQIAPGDEAAFRRLMSTLDRVTPHIDQSVFAHPYDRPWQLADPHLLATALSFDVRLTYKEFVDRTFSSPLLRSFFYGFPSYGGQTYDSKAPGALMIPYLMLQEGVFYPEGGVAAIPEAFERLALELGVEIRRDCTVRSLEHQGERIVGAKLESGEVVSGESFVSNVDRSTAQGWLGHEDSRSPSLSYFTVHWGLPEKISGLTHHTLVVPKNFDQGFEGLYRNRRFPEPPIVYLNETTATDPNAAPPGASNLFAVVTSPAEEPDLNWEAETERFRDQVVQTVNQAGITLDPSRAVFERIQTPSYFRQAHGNYRGSLYGVDEKHRLFGGLFPLANRDEQYRNLFYCGGSVQPGAGLPMVTLSGKFAAAMLS